jgi:hypothetical protein
MGTIQQGFTRHRELDPVRRALQQLTADDLLEPTNLAAQRRLRNVQSLRCSAEVQLFRPRDC